MTEYDTYWYARGYYDGRAYGFEHPNAFRLEGIKRYSYVHGYNAGIADYCDVQDGPRTSGEENPEELDI